MSSLTSLGSFRDLKGLLAESDNLDDDANIPFKVRERSYRLCYNFLGGIWKRCRIEQMLLNRVKGGMTNMLFLCKLPDHLKPIDSEPNQVLMRVYFNPETEAHLVSESVIFTLLSERHLGPRLYGIFNGGRLEEYIPSRPLSCAELANHSLSMKIAQRLARIHQLDVPISKAPDYMVEVLQRNMTRLISFARPYHSDLRIDREFQLIRYRTIFCVPFQLHQLTQKWIAQLVSIHSSPKHSNSLQEGPSLSQIERELDLIRDCLEQSTSRVVFCHNDLQEGNILLPHGTSSNIRNLSLTPVDEGNHLCVPSQTANASRLVLIDFEYASYNYRGFDFANHFCEWTMDYDCGTPPYFRHLPNGFPSHQQQRDFFRSYLIGSGDDCKHNSLGGLTHGDITDELLDGLVAETAPFVAISHFFWGVWALLQVELSPVEFGFAEYGRKRLELYYERKPDLMRLLPERSTD